MQDEVWFTLDQDKSSGIWQITIAGHGQSHVKLAKDHLIAHLDQVWAETSGLSYAYHVILDQEEDYHVELQQNEDWWPNQVDRVVPRLLPSPPMNEPGAIRHRQGGLAGIHLSRTQAAIKLALDKVRGRKGSYDFAVRLGCIALKAQHVSEDKIGKTFKKDVFLKEIDGKVELDVKKWQVMGCSYHEAPLMASGLPMTTLVIVYFVVSCLESISSNRLDLAATLGSCQRRWKKRVPRIEGPGSFVIRTIQSASHAKYLDIPAARYLWAHLQQYKRPLRHLQTPCL